MRPFPDAYASLPSKFLPLCIGHVECIDPLAQEALKAYTTWKLKFSDPSLTHKRVIDLGAFLLEGPYKELSILKPLYSSKKALKLNRYLAANKREKHFFIQKKFIIQSDASQFVVIAQKIPDIFPSQTKLLNSQEATALAALIFLGFINPLNNDQSLALTERGTIVITDPTPHDHLRKEAIMDSVLGQLYFDNALRLPRKLCLTALVKAFCPPLVKADVEKIESLEYRKGMKHSITLVAFYIFSCYAALILSTSTLSTVLIKVGIVGLTTSKLMLYSMHIFNLYQAYSASMQREKGLLRIKEYLAISGPLESKQS